jgi:hypothetical protein
MPTNSKPYGLAQDRSPLRALFVDDRALDVKLMVTTIERGGYNLTFESVDTADGFRTKLEQTNYDIIISDYNLWGWTGMDALQIGGRRRGPGGGLFFHPLPQELGLTMGRLDSSRFLSTIATVTTKTTAAAIVSNHPECRPRCRRPTTKRRP